MSQPLKRREVPVTKTFPQPLTTKTLQSSEKILYEPTKIVAPRLPQQEIPTSPAYVPDIQGLDPRQLREVTDYIHSEERRAQIEQEAREKAQQAEYQKEANKEINQWKEEEIRDIDAELTAALAAQGITKEMLQRNAKLRKQVDNWKRQNVSSYRKTLDEAQKKAIEENKDRFLSQQQAQREKLKEGITQFREDVTEDVQRQVTEHQAKRKAAELEYEKQKAEYDKQVADYEKQKAEYEQSLIDQQKQLEEQAEAEYQKQLSEYNKQLAEYEQQLTQYQQQQAEYEQQLKDQLHQTMQNTQQFTSDLFKLIESTTKSPEVLAIEKQNDAFKQALKSGQITQAQYNEAMTKQNELMKQAQKTTQKTQLKEDKTEHIQQTLSNIGKLKYEQEKKLSKLSAGGVVKIENGKAELIKPLSTLTDTEIKNLRSVGFNIPDIPKGPEMYLYEWGQTLGPQGSPQVELTEATSAVLGNILTSIVSPYTFVTSFIPGEQWGELGWRGPTTDTLKYFTYVNPNQQIALDVAGLAGTALGSMATMIPVGMGLKGITSISANIATKLGLKAPSAITKIASTISAHPKLAQAIALAPAAGLEAAHIYKQVEEGKPIDEILKEEAENIVKITAMIKGLSIGFNAFTPKQIAQVQRASKFETIQTPNGPQRILTIDTKQLPKKVADMLRIEYKTPQPGQRIFTGLQDAGKITPITTDTTQLLSNLQKASELASKSVREASIKNVLQTTVGSDGYQTLTSLVRGGEKALLKMSPEQITTVVNKNLGFGGPLHQAISKVTGEKGNLLTSFDTSKIYKLNIDDIYNSLRQGGYNSADAAYWAGKFITDTPENIVKLAKTTWKMSDSNIEYLMRTASEGGAFKNYSKITTIIKQNNLTPKEAADVVKTVLSSVDDAPKFASTLSKTDPKILKTALQLLPEEKVIPATKYMEPKTLTAILPEMPNTAMTQIVPAMNTQNLIKVVNALTPRDILKVSPYLTDAQVSNVLSSLRQEALASVLTGLHLYSQAEAIGLTAPLISGKHTTTQQGTQTLTIPQNQITATKPDKLTTLIGSLAPSVIEAIAPKLNPDSLSILAPRLTSDQLTIILEKTSPNLILQLLPTFKIDPAVYNAILIKYQITPATLAHYVRTGVLKLGTKTRGPPPQVLKRMIDIKLKQNKTDIPDNIKKIYEVKLFFFDSTETYRPTADTFKEAVSIALQRKNKPQVPSLITVQQKN